MRRFLALLLLPGLLSAANILSYNIYDRPDRVDLMLTFDTPYEGTLRQTRQQDKILIKLEESGIDGPKVKNITSPFLSQLTITPIGNETQIIAKVPPSVSMQASKTSDAYGLRLRFSKAEPAAGQPDQADEGFGALPTKPDGEFSQSYYVVITILIIGIVILLILKRRMAAGFVPAAGSSATSARPRFFQSKKGPSEDVTVRFQKMIDPKNRVVMLEYGQERYLVLVGNSNLLLEKFHGNRPVTENEFDAMLHEKHRELDSFLQLEKEKEPLQSYKEKASGLDLDELIR